MLTTCATTRVLATLVLAAILWQPSESAYGHVTVIAPVGGEVLEVGTVFTVKWQVVIQHSTQDWDLWYSTTGVEGPWIVIAADLPAGDVTRGALHTYDWTVPDDPSDEVRVRVRQDNAGADYEDISGANLTIGAGAPDCTDNDDDGYGVPGNVACPSGPEEDCNDTDPAVHPGAVEVCDDTIDNDCDGFTDIDDASCSTNVVVSQTGLAFEPAEIIVAPGDTIEWRHTTGSHTVTSGSLCTPDGRFDMPLDGANIVVTYTVPWDEAECAIPYFCIPHCGAGMTGTIIVLEATPPSLVCPQDVSLTGDAGCQAAIPILTTAGAALDNCDAGPTISQDPPAGTVVGLGDHAVTVTATDASGNTSACTVMVTVACPVGLFLRGDSNDDGDVNIADPVFVLNWLFGGGSTPGCLAASNTNGDDDVNIADPVALLNFLFGGGSVIAAPFPDCGPGELPTDGQLGCANPPNCQ